MVSCIMYLEDPCKAIDALGWELTNAPPQPLLQSQPIPTTLQS